MFKNRPVTIACLLVSLSCLLLYLPALQCGFINFDDPEYVLNNPVIRELNQASLTAMFTQSHVGWWMPLTWLSLAIDYHFWGMNPLGYHLTNILLHAVNSGLVVMIAACLCRMTATKGKSGAIVGSNLFIALLLAGLFFGVHPLRVESVVWVTERKDVLNGFFAFAAIMFYLLYVERVGKSAANRQSTACYLLAIICFSCSLMAKSISVLLPVMLLAIDWAPLGRLSRGSLRQLLLEKTPFLAVSTVITLVTFYFAAQSRYLVTYEAFPLTQRLVVSGNAVWEYVCLLLAPVGLSPFNVIPDPIPVAYTVKTVLVALLLGVIIFSGISPRIKSATLWFFLYLLPVLAFFQNGDQSFADRFTYLPSLAPALILALFLSRSDGSTIKRCLTIGAVVLLLVVYMTVTFRQIGVWKTSETFWTRTIDIDPLAITYKERGKYYHSVGRYEAAVADYTAALGIIPPSLKPYEFNFYAFRGESLREAGRYDDAIRDFTTAINVRPHPAYFFHRGLALKALGRTTEAAEDFYRSGPEPGPVLWVD